MWHWFEKLLIGNALLGFGFMTLLHSALLGRISLSKGTSHALLYGMVICAGMFLVSGFGMVTHRRAKGGHLSGLAGTALLSVLFLGYALTLLNGLETNNPATFVAFNKNFFMPLGIAAGAAFAWYSLSLLATAES